VWVREWINLDRRLQYGQYSTLVQELEREAHCDFRNYMRMEGAMFHELLDRVTPRITRQTTNFRRPLEPGLKLAITIRYMATGDSYKSLSYQFRVPHNTISLLVREVAQAIVDEYKDEVFNLPTAPDGWRAVAQRFEQRWNFPHACGALDGKHVAIRRPRRSGSLYYNYKGYYSIVLMALVDADYRFLWADVGSVGSASDSGIWNESSLKEALSSDTLGFPPAEELPHDDGGRPIPYFLLGDDAFGLRTYMMKPFARRNMPRDERIFNYRLSRGRRIVENGFGILAARWRCLLTKMEQHPDTVKTIVSGCLCLHNLMRLRYPGLQNADMDNEGPDNEFQGGAWRDLGVMADMDDARRMGGNRDTQAAKMQRIYLKHYVNTVGAVPWQERLLGL